MTARASVCACGNQALAGWGRCLQCNARHSIEQRERRRLAGTRKSASHGNGGPKCAVDGCGRRRGAEIHIPSHPQFLHAYEYESEASRDSRVGRARAPQVCELCASEKHSGIRTEVGCIETVAPPPRDFVCRCEVCRNSATASGTVRRSDCEGVVRIIW